MDPILAEIDKALVRKKLTDAAASKLAVGHPSLLKNFRMERSGEKRYNLAALHKLAQVLDLELYFGPRRTSDPEPPTIALDGDEFAAIPRVDAEASAGPGALNGGAQVVGSMAFRRDWLTARGVNPRNALLVTVTGDSMAPTISAGDIVLLDRARTEVAPPAKGRQPRIYIFDDLDGATRLKRLVRLDARTLAVLSDNAADHPPQLLHGADATRIHVHGRVIWWGHTEKDKG